MSNPNTNPAVIELRKAIGGQSIPVSFQDPETPNEQVFVKVLSVKNSDLVINCIDDEMALATIFTGWEPDKLDALDPLSFDAVIEKGKEINASFFEYCSRRVERRRKMKETFMPEMKLREDELIRNLASQLAKKVDQLKISPSSVEGLAR